MPQTIIALLILLSPCRFLSAQTPVRAPGVLIIKIRLLDSRDGKAIRGAQIALFTDQRELVWSSKTDGEGRSQVVLGSRAESVVWEAKQANGWSMARCDASFKDRYQPWPPPQYRVTTLVQSGAAAENRCSQYRSLAEPGELVVFARPFFWWEKVVASALD